MALTNATPRGYATADDVAAFLGRTFTDAQAAQANATIARAEARIDNECARSWLLDPIINEVAYSPFGLDPPSFFTSYVAGWVPLGSAIMLKQTPIQSVESVEGTGWLDSTPIILVRNLDYEVRDLETGYIRLTVPSAYYRVRTCYTPVKQVPADITQATVMLAAAWLVPSLDPDAWLVDSLQLPDLTVKYARASNTTQIPPEVDEIIENYRYRVTS